MAVRRFTDTYIRSLRFDGERKDYWVPSSEGRGVLGIRVGARTKSFVFSYRFAGKARRLTIGEFPKTTLADANAAAGQARKMLDRGEDPGKAAVIARQDERKAETVGQMCADYMADPKTAAKRSSGEMRRIIGHDISPSIGDKKAKDVTRRDISRLLDKIVERGSPIMANRTRTLLHRLFRWAISKGIVDISPVFGTERPSDERVRERALSLEEIGTFWQGVDASSMDEPLKRATKMLLVTLQRRGEVIGMHEAELDRKAATWTIPGSRTKNRREHLVVLSPLALELIGPPPDAEKLAADRSLAWIFRSRWGPGHYHANSVTHAIRDLFHPRKARKGAPRKPLTIPECRPHDLRRTGVTALRSMGFSVPDIGLVLNHKHASVTSKHYDKYDGLSEKRRALLQWSQRLAGVVSGTGQLSNVVELARA